jgi:L-asparaginase II
MPDHQNKHSSLMSETPYEPIYTLTRGSCVESIHYGAVAVVNVKGELISSYGDPYGSSFLRSTAKPFQALPFIEAGGADHFGLSPREIALICASHSGTDEQVSAVEGIQAKVGITEADLRCGTHPPIHKETADAMRLRGEEPTPNRDNCSGKHSGMLAYAKMKEATLEGYLEFDHPVQQSILSTFAEMCEVEKESVGLGIDGCSAPNFSVPFYKAAWGWARLADPVDLAPERAAACRTIVSAMMAHPDMVGGPERFDTRLMEVASGRIVVKSGAESYMGLAVMPEGMGANSPALGITMKISDGDGRGRARPAVCMEILRQLGALSPEELKALEPFGPTLDIRNRRGDLVVGEGSPTFILKDYR